MRQRRPMLASIPPDSWLRRHGMLLLAVLFIVGVGAFLGWRFVGWLNDPTLPTATEVPTYITVENEGWRTVAQVIGGAFFLFTAYFTWRSLITSERTLIVSQENLRIAQENLLVAKEGQITERFTRAIEQLGDERLTVRLGGIYALERIARDSERDHWTIMEVLTAFVRENAPWTKELEGSEPGPRRSDIQAILTVLGRRERRYEQEQDLRLDLRATNLRKMNIRPAHLERANLRGAHLEQANLGQAHLDGVDLRGAHLEGANLQGVHFKGADLQEARLEGSDLRRAHLEGTSLTRVKGLTQAQLDSAMIDEHTILPDYLKRPATQPSQEAQG
jgi:hypothetical protein